MTAAPATAAPAARARVVLVDSYAEAARLADRSHVLPVVRGPAADRLLADAQLSAGATADVDRRHFRRDATVVALDPQTRPFAALLARLSGREVVDANDALAASGDPVRPLTLVGSLDTITAPFLARAVGDGPVGVLTARDGAALVAVVARTLLFGRLPRGGTAVLNGRGGVLPSDVAVQPGAPELDALRTQPLDLLVISSHGRECAMHLGETMICGRAAGDVSVGRSRLPSGPPPCVHDRRCFVRGFDVERDVLPARELRASIVATDSCSIAKGRDARFGSRAALAPAFLDGAAVAVIGPSATGIGGLPLAAVPRMLAAGACLGDIAAGVNRWTRDNGADTARVRLLGDAGLVPWPARGGQGRDIPLAAALGVWAAPDVSALARAVRGLHRLATAGIPVEDVDVADHTAGALAEALGRAPIDPGVRPRALALARELDARAAAIQRRLAAHLLDRMRASSYRLDTTWARRCTVRPLGTGSCPVCGAELLTRYLLTHRLHAGFRVEHRTCAHCGDVLQRTGDAVLEAAWAGPDHHRRGERLRQQLVLRNPGATVVRGTAALCVLDERRRGTRTARLASVAVPARGTQALDLDGDPPPPGASLDVLYLHAYAVVDGEIVWAAKNAWLDA